VVCFYKAYATHYVPKHFQLKYCEINKASKDLNKRQHLSYFLSFTSFCSTLSLGIFLLLTLFRNSKLKRLIENLYVNIKKIVMFITTYLTHCYCYYLMLLWPLKLLPLMLKVDLTKCQLLSKGNAAYPKQLAGFQLMNNVDLPKA